MHAALTRPILVLCPNEDSVFGKHQMLLPHFTPKLNVATAIEGGDIWAKKGNKQNPADGAALTGHVDSKDCAAVFLFTSERATQAALHTMQVAPLPVLSRGSHSLLPRCIPPIPRYTVFSGLPGPSNGLWPAGPRHTPLDFIHPQLERLVCAAH